ncbi:MAG: hypothetical protein WD077_03430 [Bacteroidia bacterium]
MSNQKVVKFHQNYFCAVESCIVLHATFDTMKPLMAIILIVVSTSLSGQEVGGAFYYKFSNNSTLGNGYGFALLADFRLNPNLILEPSLGFLRFKEEIISHDAIGGVSTTTKIRKSVYPGVAVLYRQALIQNELDVRFGPQVQYLAFLEPKPDKLFEGDPFHRFELSLPLLFSLNKVGSCRFSFHAGVVPGIILGSTTHFQRNPLLGEKILLLGLTGGVRYSFSKDKQP